MNDRAAVERDEIKTVECCLTENSTGAAPSIETTLIAGDLEEESSIAHAGSRAHQVQDEDEYDEESPTVSPITLDGGSSSDPFAIKRAHHMSYIISPAGSMHSRSRARQTNRPVSDGDLVLSEEMTLRDRQEAINEVHPFGLRLWKPALYKKTRGIDNITYQVVHETPKISRRSCLADLYLYPGNIVWTILFGWWMALAYVTVTILLFTLGLVFPEARQHAMLTAKMAGYIFWPFGKFIERRQDFPATSPLLSPTSSTSDERRPLLPNRNLPIPAGIQFLGSIPSMVFYVLFYTILAPIHLVVSAVCWLAIVYIPMAKLNFVLVSYLHQDPLSLHVSSPRSFGTGLFSGEILLCTYNASGMQYYKYTYDGINIIFINLLPVVAFSMIYGYFLHGNHLTVFILCLISIIPLAYYIGMAVASISSQSSFGFGAVVNASFGSIVEIILYAIAITEGKGVLVEGAIIGSFLGTLLLLPGLSMIAGGIGPWKEQRFNVKSASVSTVLLIMALIGAFTPTLFYSIYGSHELKCSTCARISSDPEHYSVADALMKCSDCKYELPQNPETDPIYRERVRPLMYLCASILPSAYLVGLLFTLRTHVKQIYSSDKKRQTTSSFNNRASGEVNLLQEHNTSTADSRQPQQQQQEISKHDHHESGGGHDAPEWSKTKSIAILLVSTILFSLLAELLVDSVDEVIHSLGIEPKFLGLTIFAIVPSFTEFMNAIMFASYGNVALSLEIGSAYLIQVALIQIPSLVAFSAVYSSLYGVPDTLERSFTLIFPIWDCYTVFFGVFLLSYTYIEGKSNYFKGAILTLSYLVLLLSFYFAP